MPLFGRANKETSPVSHISYHFGSLQLKTPLYRPLFSIQRPLIIDTCASPTFMHVFSFICVHMQDIWNANEGRMKEIIYCIVRTDSNRSQVFKNIPLSIFRPVIEYWVEPTYIFRRNEFDLASFRKKRTCLTVRVGGRGHVYMTRRMTEMMLPRKSSGITLKQSNN